MNRRPTDASGCSQKTGSDHRNRGMRHARPQGHTHSTPAVVVDHASRGLRWRFGLISWITRTIDSPESDAEDLRAIAPDANLKTLVKTPITDASSTTDGPAGEPQLDNPVYAALTGAHARFAETRGRVVRYAEQVAPFMALPPEPTPEDWVDAAHLVGDGGFIAVAALQLGPEAPTGWTTVREFELVQMIEVDLRGVEDPGAVVLDRDDVPDALELVRATEPGPFLERTIELGRYLGIRREGVLVAMAGERMALDGWREISGVCTAPDHRGQGLAARLVGAIAGGIHARSERAFLHVVASNTGAIGLYERLGLRIRARGTIRVMTPPTLH